MSGTGLRLEAPTCGAVLAGASARLLATARSMAPPLLFGLRMWASVCLALYVVFWLQLDNPFWAGTTAAIMCQPQLGASLRKGWFRMIGTLIGAAMAVVLTACFPQDRVAFLAALALWCGVCAGTATVLRNFASYAAALAGYTAAIIAADTLGATGGPGTDVFMLAVGRASEICIGIVCAGIVLAGTDLGGARRRLAGSFAELAGEIAGRFAGVLTPTGRQQPDPQSRRRELVRSVIALEPTVDQALGESSQLRYHTPVLQMAIHGLFNALDGWRGVANHLKRLPDDTAGQEAATILRSLPEELQSAPQVGASTVWMADPLGLRRSWEKAVVTLLSLPAGTPSLQLLAEQTARLLAGLLHVHDALALLVNAPGRSPPSYKGYRLTVPDWLPPVVNAGRAFVVIGVVELFWILTAWPNGALAITFTAIVALLLAPRGDLAYAGALAFMIGTAVGTVCAAIIKFAVLPSFETFPALCLGIGLYLLPVGFGIARSRRPATFALFAAMAVISVPLIQPTNEMVYDTAQFYNLALSIFAGCGVATLSFRLLPSLTPAFRTRRLRASTLRDLRRLTIDPRPPAAADWEARMYGRLAALPDKATPLERAELLASLAVGAEIIKLRGISARLSLAPELDAGFTALSQGDSAEARRQLARLDQRLASLPDADVSGHLALRARAGILDMSEALAEHEAYFGDRWLA